jgi:4-hydroxy-4-methyl-2-oxoglutarate aldolase
MPSDGDIRARLRGFGAATLGESGARTMAARVSAAWPGARLAARAYPVRCTPGDNLAIHVAVAEAPAGSALVVDVGDRPEFGYWGEVLTTAARARDILGLVIDGGVRDIEAIEGLEFPVFSATIALRGATKKQPGAVDASGVCGDVTVAPGDWVVGDADGVVVVPGARLDEVVDAAQARTDKELRLFETLRTGTTTTIELLGLDPAPVTRAPAGRA